MTIMLSELNIYPGKSMTGISLQTSKVDSMGLQYDRRWMVVSPAGHFITQRTHPQMALVKTKLDAEGVLTLSCFGMDDFTVPKLDGQSLKRQVTVWEDQVNAVSCGQAADEWMSQVIGERCHLVYFADDEVRQCDLTYAQQGDRTGFADGFALLLISEASLQDLNSRLDTPVEMRRFRPNLVVKGCEAYAEDRWNRIQMGNMTFRVVKPCSRCVITTVDPDTGIKSGKDPLRTLTTYRRQGNGIMFGQNVIQDGEGALELGMAVTILD